MVIVKIPGEHHQDVSAFEFGKLGAYLVFQEQFLSFLLY